MTHRSTHKETTLSERAIWDQAARFADQALSGNDTQQAQDWRKADPRHEAAYRRMVQIGGDQALRDALSRFAHAPDRPKPWWRRPSVVYGVPVALAACLCLLVMPPVVAEWMTPLSVYDTPAGQTRVVVLADGSRVTLNGGTRLEARLTAWRREVRLKAGEAYFAVAPDPQRPFDVRLEQGKVRVIGTQFNLSYLPEGVELDVYEGKVRLSDDQRSYGLFTRGMRARLEDGVLKPGPRFDPEGGDWRAGWIEPESWPLERVVLALSRHSGVPIRFADESLKHKRIVGRIRLDDPLTQLEPLALMHGFSIEREGDGLVLK